jgi:phosphomannomutase/phosphoglucomutase
VPPARTSIDLGMVATPMTYFAATHLGTGAASWSPAATTRRLQRPQDGRRRQRRCRASDIQDCAARIEARAGSRRRRQLFARTTSARLLDRIVGDVKLARPMQIAVDCGNGVAGAFAPALYRRMGCDVVELFCEVDGHFPNHHPDPSQPRTSRPHAPAGTGDCELGFAFDGDGDRLAWSRRDGRSSIPIASSCCSPPTCCARAGRHRHLRRQVHAQPEAVDHAHGGVPLLWKTGHSLIKAKMKETHAALAGEMSGHTFFGERWYGFDDGLYAGARLLEILSRHDDPGALLESLPDALSTPELTSP